jgi:hypothetical protein
MPEITTAKTADEFMKTTLEVKMKKTLQALRVETGGGRLGGWSGFRRGVAGDKCDGPGVCEGRLRLRYGYLR